MRDARRQHSALNYVGVGQWRLLLAHLEADDDALTDSARAAFETLCITVNVDQGVQPGVAARTSRLAREAFRSKPPLRAEGVAQRVDRLGAALATALGGWQLRHRSIELPSTAPSLPPPLPALRLMQAENVEGEEQGEGFCADEGAGALLEMVLAW